MVIFIDTVAGAIVSGIIFVVGLLVVFAAADGRAASDFYRVYANERGLKASAGKVPLPGYTGLLRMGVRRYASEAFAGRLPGGTDGMLVLYTYETESRDAKGNRHVQYHLFTVLLAKIPGGAQFIGQLACQRRVGFRFLDSAEDVFRDRQRVEFESVELDEQAEIFVGEGDDMNRARQLFSPTFIDWLAHEPDNEELAFELEAGILAVNVPGHGESSIELDAFCERAARVVERFREEAAEAAETSDAPGEVFDADLDPLALVTVAPGVREAARKNARKGIVWLVVGGLVGLVIGVLQYRDEESDSDGSNGYSLERELPPEGSSEGERIDLALLGALKEIRDGQGAHSDELYGYAVVRSLVGPWITHAAIEGWITFDSANRRIVLTRDGERRLKELRGR